MQNKDHLLLLMYYKDGREIIVENGYVWHYSIAVLKLDFNSSLSESPQQDKHLYFWILWCSNLGRSVQWYI